MTAGLGTLWRVPPVSAVADVLALWGYDGWLTPPLTPVVAAGQPQIARARVVRVEPTSARAGIAPLYELLSSPLDGCALVLVGADGVAGAMWGEIMATAADNSRLAGALVDGAVRDLPEITAIAVPTYARRRCVVGPNGHAQVAAIDEPGSIDGVTIASGDQIVMDANGCVRIEAALADRVLEAARRYAAAEASVVQAQREGETLAVAYRHKKAIVEELRAEAV